MQPIESQYNPVYSFAALVQRARLVSGLVLFSYVATHLANHSLGLISLEAMEVGRVWFLSVWRSSVGTIFLYGALSVHLALALWSLYQRRHFRIPAWQWFQLLLGLAIPTLLGAHIVGTRLAHEWFDTTDSYTRMILIYWQLFPEIGVKQSLLLTIAWLHGCVGLHFWLRLKHWYPRVTTTFFAVGLLLPVLALLGFIDAGREISRLAQQPDWVEQTMREAQALDSTERAIMARSTNAILVGFAASLVIVLITRVVRWVHGRYRNAIRITYPDNQKVTVTVGFTVLEASRQARIPHASVCGGRGRCSTCRVRVVSGLEFLPPDSAEEQRVLRRVGMPPNVRLACQLRPTRDLSVKPLLPASARASDGFAHPRNLAGQEMEIVVLFADLRGFTTISERKLPYDVVFLLNSYFHLVGNTVEKAGGIVNQFVGDGVMALFGLESGPKAGSHQALTATGAIFRGIDELSGSLREELEAPLKIGIGIHVGPAVVGRMGHGEAMYLTAVGDTINVASRLQDLTKEYNCQLVISDRVAEQASINVSPFPRHELTVRNRREPIVIRTIADVRDLTNFLDPSSTKI